ncbi:glycine zipper 2TM domain-containing protein [Thiohalobacter sp. IOR34]|uniref:glycine zipper 2TM domain-containing protein n=1 Tax=Thiohalobacter sp. IOR34 TaxID=3057176 RepID=UPI0025AF646D|nr:glycine zipper 2TM domain-containing protein [Thiohalobacter sp. IOR34]WJW75407.1 glycine zipper 2TM domain-containing protein [Thiohalobacter sp. IOR34]
MNKMKKTFIALFAGLTLASAMLPAEAGPRGRHHGFSDYATVVGVEPIVKYVRVAVPRQECWDEAVPVYQADDYRSATPMILGGIIGGVIGHEMGKGRGKDAATIAGTILGGSIGRDIGYRDRPPAYDSEVRRRCRTVNDYEEEERVEGYRVTYRYQGREFTTRMASRPGRRLRVRVTVEPDF